MAREFKPARFFLLMAVMAFLVCGAVAFYTQRAAHGRTNEERAAYALGLKTGADATAQAKLPSDAELNMMAQRAFEGQGASNKQTWIWPLKMVMRMDSAERIRGDEWSQSDDASALTPAEAFPLAHLFNCACSDYSICTRTDIFRGVVRRDRQRKRLPCR
jgi:hypothetical protein